jgi:hypothetical protein
MQHCSKHALHFLLGYNKWLILLCASLYITVTNACRASSLTIEEVEAGQRAPAAAAAAASGESSLLLPKSVRIAMREQQAAQAADKQLHEDAAVSLEICSRVICRE